MFPYVTQNLYESNYNSNNLLTNNPAWLSKNMNVPMQELRSEDAGYSSFVSTRT